MVITGTPGEVDGAKEPLTAMAAGNSGNKSIVKYSFEGKMKECPISKLTITKTGHRPS